MTDPVVLHVVVHTHWDREWYAPFEGFRHRLLPVMDAVLAELDADDSFRFLCDGQTAMLDDYLAIRPEREPDIRRHAASGRLAVGPWVTLADTLLVSGETLVRDLQIGLARATDLAGAHGPLTVGYVPDAFGHTAQLPQVLRLAGFDTAVLWRGVPSEVDRTLFQWAAPDGSDVTVGYLATSYSNGAALPTEPDELPARARSLVAELQAFAPAGQVLVMCGTDHWPPPRGLSAAFAAANANDPAHHWQFSGLDTYLAAARAADAAADPPITVTGELRSGARANVLMGVTSTRVDLKQLQAAAERGLERYAEPLAAVAGHLPPPRLGELAWRHLVLNAAHDSVCSCSSDETMAAVEVRYQEAAAIARGLTDDAAAVLAARISRPHLHDDTPAVIVWNPSPFARGGWCEVEFGLPPNLPDLVDVIAVDPDGAHLRTVTLDRATSTMFDAIVTGEQMLNLVNEVRGRQFGDVFINRAEIIEEASHTELRFHAEEVMRGHLDADALRSELTALAATDPQRRFRVAVFRPPRIRALVHLPEIAGLGWTTLHAIARPAGEAPPAATAGPMLALITTDDDDTIDASTGIADDPSGRVLDDGVLRIEVDDDTGTFDVIDADSGRVLAENWGTLVDGGDAGDTYNWSPPTHDRIVRDPAAVEVDVIESNIARGTLRIRRRYLLPERLADDGSQRSDDTTDFVIDCHVTLWARNPTIELEWHFDHTVADHRLRALFDLPGDVTHTWADVAFGAQRRELAAEGSDQEFGLATYPAKRWADATPDAAATPGAEASGLALITEGTLEYEVVPTEVPRQALAVTLVRATGMLSRPAPALRPNAAGPPVPVRHAQSPGPQRVRFGLCLHPGTPFAAGVNAAADEFAHPFVQTEVRGPGDGDLAPSGRSVHLDAGHDVMLSALTRHADALECRVVNCGPSPRQFRLHLDDPAVEAGVPELVDLRGDVTEPLPAGAEMLLGGWKIATVRIPLRARHDSANAGGAASTT